MSLGKEVGLVPGHTVLDGDPVGTQRSPSTLFGPCLLWPNGRPSQQLLSSCKAFPNFVTSTGQDDIHRNRRNCTKQRADEFAIAFFTKRVINISSNLDEENMFSTSLDSVKGKLQKVTLLGTGHFKD